MALPSGDWENRNSQPMGSRVLAVLSRFYKGKTDLVPAFWGYCVLGGIAARMAGGLLIGLGGRTPQAFSFGIGFWLAYSAFATIGVWRCANAYPYTRWWPGLAKLEQNPIRLKRTPLF